MHSLQSSQQTETYILLTQQAYDQLIQEKNSLLNEQKELKKRLKDAREQGDLSENGAYKYAKIELGDVARRLRKINSVLPYAHVAKKKDQYSKVEFGCTVVVDDGHRQRTYLMVSEHESNPLEGKLALSSPIGAALANKKAGDSVTVKVPAGMITLKIVQIQ